MVVGGYRRGEDSGMRRDDGYRAIGRSSLLISEGFGKRKDHPRMDGPVEISWKEYNEYSILVSISLIQSEALAPRSAQELSPAANFRLYSRTVYVFRPASRAVFLYPYPCSKSFKHS